ncbi:MAG: phenylalanine--tRNA ligase subunit beta [Anaerolineales bacterium]|nr:phenylalanine--tRNA ligase subunit beta [Anaerolineales bacterium]
MNIPLSWLKEYVDITVPVHTLAERLTLAGLEVETIDLIGLPGAELPWAPDKILVGEVLSINPHPNADRLVLVEVDYGGAEHEICVTGAPSLVARRTQENLHLKVAFAQEGARIYDGHAAGRQMVTLKQSKIRGVPSRAMVCSEKELGLSDEHEDIIYLPADAPVGTPLVDYMGDAILGFDVKGPFAHLHSVIGVAREAAALLDLPLRRDALETLDRHAVRLTATPPFAVLEIEAPDLCPRYSAAFIEGITVAPSPIRMQLRLRSAGVRPINNIVDVTNYVMLELGQPLHAFDYHWLHRRPGEDHPAIIVRRAKPGEQMRTLDGEMRTFDGEMLLITDGAGPVAVAGVMGGSESEVTEQTRDVLLEAANFNFLSVRRTSRLLGMMTEANLRFGRQVAPDLTIQAAARAAYLMAELGGGAVAPLMGDVYPGRRPQPVIQFDPAQTNRILGVDVPRQEVIRILSALEFEVTSQGEEGPLSVCVPSHRQDVTRPIDLVEEVGRIWGYDRFPATLALDELPPQRTNRRLEGSERVRDVLVGCGLDEVITYSLMSLDDERRLGLEVDPDRYISVRNPLSAERATLRQTLLPSLLHTTRENLRFADHVAIFEVGAVYIPVEGQLLPEEPQRLAIVITGPREARSWVSGQDRSLMGFYELKGIAEGLLKGLHLAGTFEPGQHPALHPGRSAQLRIGDAVIGVLGELHPRVRERFDLPAQPVCALELDLDLLLAAWGAPRTITSISPHPPVYEDLAVVVAEDVPAARIVDLINQTGGALVRSVVLFDIYRGEQVGAGRKSLAYRLIYQADDRTLTDKEVAKLREKIVRRLTREVDASLRG